MKSLSFTVLFLFCLVLSGQDRKSQLFKGLNTQEEWDVRIIKQPEHKYLNFKSEIRATFTHKSNAPGVFPRIDFYPRFLRDTIVSRQIQTNRLSSDFNTPSPEMYLSQDYFILTWGMNSHYDKVCHNCEKLRYALIRDLKMRSYLSTRIINRAFDADGLHYSDQEIRSIIEQILNLSNLNQYFHIEEDPGKVPLVLEQTSIVQAARLEGLKKFGQDVLILDRNEIDKGKFKSYLLIDKWFMENGLLNIQLHYPIEGMFTTASFEKVIDGWVLKSHKIAEY